MSTSKKTLPSYEVIEGITHVIHEGKRVGRITFTVNTNPCTTNWQILFNILHNDKPRTMLVKGSFETEQAARSFLDKAFHTIQRRFKFA